MVAEEIANTVHSLEIKRDLFIAASIDTVFAELLNPPGRMREMSVKIEPFPGGRWYRDLGNSTGHLWGHVQVIKPPKLLELYGPMFMSYAAVSHVQYRLTEEGKGTRLALVHTAIGLITPEHREGVQKGWQELLSEIQSSAEKKSSRS